jgi:hypothetical protein
MTASCDPEKRIEKAHDAWIGTVPGRCRGGPDPSGTSMERVEPKISG